MAVRSPQKGESRFVLPWCSFEHGNVPYCTGHYCSFNQLDHPVAITAPLEADERVLIGLYCELIGFACIDISVQAFQSMKHGFYDPKGFRLLVHGIKRIWESWDVGNHDTWTDGIADTEIMAYLLDSGLDEQEYSLSHLARRYLGTWIIRRINNKMYVLSLNHMIW